MTQAFLHHVAPLERKGQTLPCPKPKQGSFRVRSLKSRLAYARGTSECPKRHRIEAAPITVGDLCAEGTQLRPDIVWPGEEIESFAHAHMHMATAALILVVGAKLSIFPATSLAKATHRMAHKVLVAPEVDRLPYRYEYVRGEAADVVPRLVARWKDEGLAAAS